ncbi:hypothetical protein LJC46_04190 [Desulfovibrio sp. OttesenSCG-928-G15]|nr:hypothetical protein [Desulfovibrio sp. OttesenSCG-928-G15]
MSAVGKYRAKADCRAGGMFRRTGEVFEMTTLKTVPAHLEEIGSGKEDIGAGEVAKTATPKVKSSKPKTGKPAAVPKEAQVGKEDIGAGIATPVQDVTSSDMVTK